MNKKVNDEFKQGKPRFEPVDYNYKAETLSKQMLNGRYQASAQWERPESSASQRAPETFQVEGRETKAIKQAMLASNSFATGESTLRHYSEAEQPVEVVDLVIGSLPADCDPKMLKKISGVKHVIAATVEEDNFRGICTGQGRIQIRLNQGETAEKVKLNFARLGYKVSDFEQDPRKKPIVTGLPKETSKEITNHRLEKQNFLQTQSPDIFGTSTKYYPQRN